MPGLDNKQMNNPLFDINKLSNPCAIFGGFVYDNLQWYLIVISNLVISLVSYGRTSLPCSRPDQTTFLPQGLASIRLPGGCFLKEIILSFN